LALRRPAYRCRFTTILMCKAEIYFCSANVLSLNGTVYRIHSGGKLDALPFASGLDDTPPMRGDGGIDKGLSDGLEPG
jgi:hypothetical protein